MSTVTAGGGGWGGGVQLKPAAVNHRAAARGELAGVTLRIVEAV
jgi:hypothetical protein